MDLFNLKRFLDAQESVYSTVLEELRAEEKRTHWMWFIFPQIQGLGKSQIARFYAISGLEEAHAYLRHPILGSRLVECCEALLTVSGKNATEILGSPDDLKLRSCATLFSKVKNSSPIFALILVKYYNGEPDPYTESILQLNDYSDS